MSTKIEIGQVADVLKKTELSPAILRQVIEELNLIAHQDDEEKAPAIKKQFVILISDPENRLPKHDFTGWVLQIPDTESVATTQDRLLRSAYDFNATKKGRLMPVKSIGEAIECVPSRFFAEADLWVKTKMPVLMLRSDNQIPRDNSAKAA